MPKAINEKIVAALPIPERGNRVHYFGGAVLGGKRAPQGFCVRVTSTGTRSFCWYHRVDSRPHLETIGKWVGSPGGGSHTVMQGLLAVRALADAVAHQGADPRPTWQQEVADGIAGIHQRAAAKALTFIARDAEPACYLYRHYHPDGDLLYVGISLEPLRRQVRHTKSAGWRNMICQIVIEPFATREQALAAEKLAIRSEFPRFNAAHNGHRHPIQELAPSATTALFAGPGEACPSHILPNAGSWEEPAG
jgi:hypothetical protein